MKTQEQNKLKEIAETAIKRGDLKTASKNYEKLLKSNPNNAEFLKRFGQLKAQEGNYNMAVKILESSIKINQNDYDAFYSLGLSYQNIGLIEKAIECYNKSNQLNPNISSFNNLASIYWSNGQRLKAISTLEQCLEKGVKRHLEGQTLSFTDPKLTESSIMIYANLSMMYRNTNSFLSSINCASKVILSNSDPASRSSCILNFCQSISVLSDEDFPENLPETLSALESILDEGVETPELGFHFIKFLFKDFNLNQVLSSKEFGGTSFLNEERISNLINEDITILEKKEFYNILTSNVVIKYLKTNIVSSVHSESIFTNLRKYFLFKFKNKNTEFLFDNKEMISALSIQSEYNGFIWNEDPEEILLLDKIKKDIILSIEKNINPNQFEIEIILFSCFKRLNDEEEIKDWLLLNIEKLSDSLREIIENHILIYNRIYELSQTIEKISIVENDTSLKVKKHYENYPYPRWKGKINKSITEAIININYTSSYLKKLLNKNAKMEVLVAGSGTGREPLSLSSYYLNSKITAVDLSTLSLAYCKMKTKENHIDNIKLIEGDILKLEEINKKFDIISSCGVLHHMEEPIKGIKVLSSLLKPGGAIKIGLYSSIARSGISAARKKINQLNLNKNSTNIKKIRNLIKEKDEEFIDIHRLINSKDFYSYDDFQDLLFHPRELHFTLKEIENLLRSGGLEFVEFDDQYMGYKEYYKTQFPNDKNLSSIENWTQLEKKHPNMFSRMYVFWAKKN